MPIPYRASFFFQDTSGYGWSENYHYYGSTPNFVAASINLAEARLGFLPSDVSLNYIRRSTGTLRDVGFTVVNNNPGLPNGQWPAVSVPDFTALKTRISSAASGTARIFYRTLPVDQITEDGYDPTAAFTKAVNSYADILTSPTANGEFWAVRTNLPFPPPANGNPRLPATNLQPLSPRGFTFLTSNATLTTGTNIRVAGARVFGYNGIKTITAVAGMAPLFTISVGGASPVVAEPVTSAVNYTIQTYLYNALSTFAIEGITRRSPGRFFGQRRGRASTRLSLRQ